MVWVPFDATNQNWRSRLPEEEEEASEVRSIYEVMRRHNYHYEAARLKEEEEDEMVRSIYEVMRGHNYHYEAARLPETELSMISKTKTASKHPEVIMGSSKTASRHQAEADLPSPITMALTSARSGANVFSVKIIHVVFILLSVRL